MRVVTERLDFRWKFGAAFPRKARRRDGDGDEFGWLFEDNFFDLLPNHPRDATR